MADPSKVLDSFRLDDSRVFDWGVGLYSNGTAFSRLWLLFPTSYHVAVLLRLVVVVEWLRVCFVSSKIEERRCRGVTLGFARKYGCGFDGEVPKSV